MKTNRRGSNSHFRPREAVRLLRDIYRFPSKQPEPLVQRLYVAKETEGVIKGIISEPRPYTWSKTRPYAQVRVQNELLNLRLTSIAHT